MSISKSRTKEELVLAARAKGWHGNRGATTKPQFIAWLEARNVGDSDIPNLANVQNRNDSAPTALSRNDIEDIVKDILSDSATTSTGGSVDEEAVKRIVRDLVTVPTVITLSTPKGASVTLKEHTHPMFEKVLKLTNAGLNVLLVGPAGSGKTTLASQIAKATRRNYGTLHCTAGASESQLTGWLLPVGDDGKFTYVPAEFVKMYEEGNAVFLIDEMDGADPNMLMVINSALANGEFHIPQRYEQPFVKRGPNFTIIAAANTFGVGADQVYAGRNQLDGATLDRFYVVTVDYDIGLERKIVGTDSDDNTLATWVWNLRSSVRLHGLRRVVSTRTIMKSIAARHAGLDSTEIKADILAGWKRDELSKVGVM